MTSEQSTDPPFSRHCSMGSADNWTDLVTNVTSIEPQRFGADARKWTGIGSAPPEQLSVFIHEATHHWCFTSPVATTLAALSFRARRRAAILSLADNPNAELARPLLDDLVRVETAMSFLRPLAEGLAVFAEFDAISKIRSQALSPLMRWITVLYSGPEALAQAPVNWQESNEAAAFLLDEARANLLARLRLDPATLNRKIRVLLRPFQTGAGGYLPGYLTVKSLWRSAGRNCPRLMSETDLFLMYLRSFFYDDLGFVAVLLDESTTGEEAVTAIIRHISGRLDEIDRVTESDLIAYERSIISRADSTEQWGPIEGIHVSDDAATGMDELIADLWDKLLRHSQELGEFDKLPWLFRVQLSRRQLLHLGSIDVEVSVSDTGHVVAREGDCVLYEGPALPDVDPGVSSGIFEVVFSMQGYSISRALVVARNNKVVSCEVVGPTEQVASVQQLVIDTFMSRPMILNMDRATANILASIVDIFEIKDELSSVREKARPWIDEMYKDVALRFAKDYDAIDSCATLMREQGCRPLLRRSELVKGAAFIGMVCSLNPDTKFVATAFRDAGLDLEATLNGLKQCYDEYGFPPLPLVAGNQVFSTI